MPEDLVSVGYMVDDVDAAPAWRCSTGLADGPSA
jgi:hypothetical protein